MAGKKSCKNGKTKENDITASRVNEVIDSIIKYVADSPQLDSYYKEMIAEIAEIEKNYLPIVSKRFIKEGSKEREIILEVLKYLTGIDHINFLQKFVKNEVFLPRTGIKILDVFNKSDLILDDGIASSLLELENLTQRIKHSVLTEEFDNDGEDLILDYIKKSENEKEGIILEVIEDTGFQALNFIIKAIEKDIGDAEKIIKFVASFDAAESVKFIEGIYKGTTSKDVQKTIKRIIHSLKQKGINIVLDSDKKEKESVLKKAELADSSAYSSIIDAEGHRFIFVVKPVTAHENKVFNILLSDIDGIKDIEVMTTVRKEANKLVKKILSDEKTEFFEIPVEYASFIVDEARTLTENNGRVVSGNIAQWDSLFADSKTERHQAFIYDLISRDVVAEKELSDDDIKCLSSKKDMTFWFLTSDYAKEQWEKITDVLKDEKDPARFVKEGSINKMQEESLKVFFDAGKIKSFIRRLEEVAYYYYYKGYKDMALSALRVAESFSSPEMKPEQNIFCKAVITSGFDFFINAYAEEVKRRAAQTKE